MPNLLSEPVLSEVEGEWGRKKCMEWVLGTIMLLKIDF